MRSASKTILLLSASALALAGCTTGPISDEPVRNGERTQSGAVIGGIVGAIGGAIDNDLEGAIIGGAIGAGVGAAIGQTLDRQARDLEAQLDNPDVRIENTGSQLIVTLPQDILFATDSAIVSPGLVSDLQALARNLQQYPNSVVQVQGHTDSTGTSQYNLQLSARRATAVANILYDAGVNPSRVVPQGRGEEQPLATNLTEAGKAQNRRVEIIIQPTA
jgi:outer membrane protein OmpA-like peptidoglycan-associated protein